MSDTQSRPLAGANHPNVGLIRKLYTSIIDGDADAISSCYSPDGYFEDIAFRLHGRYRIRDMWRMVCNARPLVTFDQLVADDRSGSGHWTAHYTFRETNRPVANDLHSEFTFENGHIKSHKDRCNALRWGLQAFGFPKGIVAGLVGPIRRHKAKQTLENFLKTAGP